MLHILDAAYLHYPKLQEIIWSIERVVEVVISTNEIIPHV